MNINNSNNECKGVRTAAAESNHCSRNEEPVMAVKSHGSMQQAESAGLGQQPSPASATHKPAQTQTDAKNAAQTDPRQTQKNLDTPTEMIQK